MFEDAIIARFEAKFIPEPNSGCWLWFGATTAGYGTFWHNGKSHKAHRLAFQIWCGPIPEGLDIMHSCDMPSCVNPDHLTPGTTRQNVLDMWAKNRGVRSRGERNGNSRLTNDGLRRIRDMDALGYEYSYIAKRVGISRTMVSRIASGNAWRSADV